jgi:ribose-phosphate pyrophosphokinase
MNVSILAGSANPQLADSIADILGLQSCRRELVRFPDGELHVDLQETVRGCDVYIVQPTGPPVDQHLVELLFLADASRRAGAARITAVIPYFGYARQDRRVNGRESVGARVAAELLETTRIERIVAVDLHVSSLEGFFRVPVEHLSAVDLLANALEGQLSLPGVIVAPDLGAVKLAERYAELLHLPIAIVHKTRISGEEVRVRGIVGDVRGRAPVIIDDMISTGGTIDAACEALMAVGCVPELTVAATHALLVGQAMTLMSQLPLKRLLVTNSLALPRHGALPIQVISLAPMLAEVVSRLNVGQSLHDLIGRR